ncbi:MAG: sigma-70 family RNA polymerase sigma factor [Verrucomicrobia bacterium]|nr:sigma-70 family RNA polymerase sigma factor [Verrucomicrobiota bacterium]MBI3870543.1 sigma-70 family RNA polymerase sigma factor [Verrucomicrobiota bacterium]
MKLFNRSNPRKAKSPRTVLPASPRGRHRESALKVAAPLQPQSIGTNVVNLFAEPPSPPVVPQPAWAPAYSRRDAFDIYLREIGQTPLLTPAQEVALARRVQSGDPEAREQMIKANLRLVVKIAREYEGLGVPLLDLISEGNMGLMKGVERFDPDKGAKLSTYAAWWIKQNIRRALDNQSKTVRLPSHVLEKRAQIRQVEAKLLEVLKREPNDTEIARELGLDPGWVRHYRQALITASSFDAPLGSDEDASRLLDVVPDPSATDPSEEASSQADGDLVREVLDTLNDREQEILRLRFGLAGDDERTLEQIGEQFGLTRERIRQIQERALHKMRARIEQRESTAMPA